MFAFVESPPAAEDDHTHRPVLSKAGAAGARGGGSRYILLVLKRDMSKSFAKERYSETFRILVELSGCSSWLRIRSLKSLILVKASITGHLEGSCFPTFTRGLLAREIPDSKKLLRLRSVSHPSSSAMGCHWPVW